MGMGRWVEVDRETHADTQPCCPLGGGTASGPQSPSRAFTSPLGPWGLWWVHPSPGGFAPLDLPILSLSSLCILWVGFLLIWSFRRTTESRDQKVFADKWWWRQFPRHAWKLYGKFRWLERREVYFLLALEAESLESRWRQGPEPSEAWREVSSLASSGFWQLHTPWLVDASLWSFLHLHGVPSSCVSLHHLPSVLVYVHVSSLWGKQSFWVKPSTSIPTWPPCVWVCVWVCVCTQSCLTLSDCMDCGPPVSTGHGIFKQE